MTPVELCQKRIDEMNEAHYNWLKFQVTLSAGMISVLVAFRTSAPPEIPWSVWLLRLGLLAFAATVLSGIICSSLIPRKSMTVASFPSGASSI